MSAALAALERDQTRGEEIANSVSHGAGLLAAVVATPFLIIDAVHSGDPALLVGVCVFAGSMLLLYAASTLYHALPRGETKRVLRVIEHSAIYLLIAGTYTPFTLGVLGGAWGWTLLGLVWGLAAVGVSLKLYGRAAHPAVSTALYVAMGWLIVVAVHPLFTRMPAGGLAWLFAGGAAYTVGVAFFATDARLRYGHFVWHLCVLAGTTCHVFAVLWHGG